MNTQQLIVHRYLDGFRHSDHDAVLGCLTDDVVWTIHGLRTTYGKAEFGLIWRATLDGDVVGEVQRQGSKGDRGDRLRQRGCDFVEGI